MRERSELKARTVLSAGFWWVSEQKSKIVHNKSLSFDDNRNSHRVGYCGIDIGFRRRDRCDQSVF